MPAKYWYERLEEIQADYYRATQSRVTGATLDALALKNYLGWIRGKLAKSERRTNYQKAIDDVRTIEQRIASGELPSMTA